MDISIYRKKMFNLANKLMDVFHLSTTVTSQDFESQGEECHSFSITFQKFYNENDCKIIGDFSVNSWYDKKQNNKSVRELKKFVEEFNIDNY